MELNIYGEITQATAGSAGYDMYNNETAPVRLQKGSCVAVRTGVYMALPKDVVALVCPRSGLASKGVTVVNAPGVIDSDYRGEIKVLLTNLSNETVELRKGDRIAQLVFTPVLHISRFVTHVSQTSLSVTERGDGGFGSTGE